MQLEELKTLNAQHQAQTYSRFDVALESGQGAALYDSEGRLYIDFASGIGVNALGYGDPAWVKAVSEQAAALPHISNLYYTPAQEQFAAKLTEASGFQRVFLANSGAEANECAIKTARKYSFDKYGKGRSTIVTLRDSFHGRTLTTLSATGQDVFHNFFFPFTEGFRFVKAGDLADTFANIDDSVCAVMLEPVQGEGGVKPLDKAYVQAVASHCRVRDILLIFDEVQTGVGRTGKLYAWEHFGVRPDLLTSAKGLAGGLPLGACLMGDKCADVLGPGHHASTFGGNPVACAGASVVLDRVCNPAFLEEVARKGERLRERLMTMPGVQAVRGWGLMLGIALERENALPVAQACVKAGLLVLTAKTVVRFLPPLVITDTELSEGLGIFEKVLKEANA